MSQSRAQKPKNQFSSLSDLQLDIKERLLHGYALLRSTHFTVQQMILPLAELVSTGKTPVRPKAYAEKYAQILPDLSATLKLDAQNIARGVYPLEVLKPEKWIDHSFRFPKILKDGYSISQRRESQEAKEFSPEAQGLLFDLPEYYRRNFHYQTDGYLSDHSAELYEHQVEILFSGVADAMRRSLIVLLKERLPEEVVSRQGEGLRFLEVAAGTGRLTKFMKMCFPKAEFVVLDLSEPYLRKASMNLKEFSGIEFTQGAAEDLVFSEGTFDFVYSCFLFHELPRDVREKVVSEGLRVLKPGGFYGLVDSVQETDAQEYQWALEQFPRDFHEPFYKNYIQFPMEEVLQAAGFKRIESRRCFLSKAVIAQKAEKSAT